MDVRQLAAVLRARGELRRHERWTRADLLMHQAAALGRLRAHATAHSPFYRQFHARLGDRRLQDLPVLTKATLMEHFDDVVTDRAVRLTDVERYLEMATAIDRFHGRYRVAATAGTTGRRGVFLADPDEWTTILASYARANDWAGLQVGLTHRLKMAVVSSRKPTHQSSIVGATVASPFVPTLRLDATEPLLKIVAALNAFGPRSLVAYASMLRVLADAQLAGQLRIAPRAVLSASEVLTDESRTAARDAWGVEPYNVYAATETAGIASECEFHRLHLYEDLVITEAVDDAYRPVPEGVTADKLLVTVLFSRTQPLIRYELSDRVRAAPGACRCGRLFALLDAIEGRLEEVLDLPAQAGGTVSVHPNTFHAALEALAPAGWQVIEEPGRLRILVVNGTRAAAIESAVSVALERQGVMVPPVTVEPVAELERTSLGKAPLVRRWRS